MDDYRDLMTVSLALLCAGIMLVAGQLYVEHRAPDLAREEIEAPAQPVPPMVSHTLQQNIRQPARDSLGKRPT